MVLQKDSNNCDYIDSDERVEFELVVEDSDAESVSSTSSCLDTFKD